MKNQIEPLAKLANRFLKLPGVGARMAQRFAYAVVGMSQQEVDELCECLQNVKSQVKHCSVCGNLTDIDPCHICNTRNHSQICVVAYPKDVIAIEKARAFFGVYHVLFGTISPLDKRGPNDIRIKELITRVSNEQVSEVILATNPDVEGEATAAYIAKLLKTLDIKTTRVATGISLGSEIEYADEVSLSRAIEDRRQL